MKFKVLKTDGKGRPWAYEYKEYEIRRTGTTKYPYNIYDKNSKHVGFDRTIKDCIADIEYIINNPSEDNFI